MVKIKQVEKLLARAKSVRATYTPNCAKIRTDSWELCDMLELLLDYMNNEPLKIKRRKRR